jgi:large subunit ribosomal protein L23
MARKKAAVAKAVKSNATIHDYEVIIKPVITEKSMLLMQNENKVTLEVKKDANKIEIKKAFENIFGVKVTTVAVSNVPSKTTTRGGRYKGTISGYKKAIVTVKDGEAIDLFKD